MGTGIAKLLGLSNEVQKLKDKKKFIQKKFEVKKRAKTKVFCIGRNKTGTTSFEIAMRREGYYMGDQRSFEKLGREFRNEIFDNIIELCKSAEAFQDFPFSYPEMYKVLDKNYPNSKFILTIRSSSEEWYNSITKFHSKLFGNGKIPSVNDLKNAKYIEKGWMWENFVYLYGISEDDDPYDKQRLIRHYENYNNEVIKYFNEYPEQLLILNLSEDSAFQKFCDFIEIESKYSNFPWKNKTASIKNKFQ